jgi:hypothetical protein
MSKTNAEYQREWRKNNSEKWNQTMRNYRKNNPAKIKAIVARSNRKRDAEIVLEQAKIHLIPQGRVDLPWTNMDDAVILHGTGTIKEKAIFLNRSFNACTSRYYKLKKKATRVVVGETETFVLQ